MIKNTLAVICFLMLSATVSAQFSYSVNAAGAYTTPPILTAANAKKVISYGNLPESVLVYFLASKINNTSDWAKTLAPKAYQDGRMDQKLEDYKRWKFLEAKLISVKMSGITCYITVYMKLEIEGAIDEGEDVFTLMQVGGKWYIKSIPT